MFSTHPLPFQPTKWVRSAPTCYTAVSVRNHIPVSLKKHKGAITAKAWSLHAIVRQIIQT